ncbi:hypothetical protein CXB51_034963 [Gossypium anomalum]|uniref:Transposase-associated domain-containing protein n=1 Tax=Gossypium anomalum TaxID=47600 RepID=A0A8J5XQF4_9ROSI|nr:hypothetical protein CXB51_034963 [Gossypium anomalum]
MDRSWMNLSRKCGNINWHFREVVYEHLIVDGFIRGYKKWIFHGECTSSRSFSTINPTYPDSAYHHHGEQLFAPEFIVSDDCNIGGNVFTKTGTSAPDEEPNEEAAKFYNLLNEMNKELYEGSNIRNCPSSCQDMKRLIKDLGLGYDKIHSCPNDCMLYWGDQKNQQSFHVCGKSHWMDRNTEDVNADEGGAQLRKKPVKVLRYFPLISRLQRLFMSSKTADSMSKFSSFASDPQNVRLGLAADDFNPFKIMSNLYSTWPVVIVPYNLPPWICMKQSLFILSMIIPREKGPGNDIDIYLQPHIEELKQLWSGAETYDSTKGCYACPCCAAQACSKWLYNGKKFSYMGHQRWLDGNHKFRFQRTLFDGTEEYRGAPKQTIGSEILFMLKDINFSYGKMNQPPNTQTKRRLRDESDEEDDPNDADL